MNASSVTVLVAALLAGCASSAASPVVRGRPFVPTNDGLVYSNAKGPNQGPLETRHIYLFAPGKDPVLLVSHSETSSEQVSAADLDQRKQTQ